MSMFQPLETVNMDLDISTEKEYPLVPAVTRPLEEGKQCHPCNHLFKWIHSLTSALMWGDQLFRMENYSLIVPISGNCKYVP